MTFQATFTLPFSPHSLSFLIAAASPLIQGCTVRKSKSRKFALLLCLLVLSTSSILKAQGKVYLVLGSDTAIWDNMDTGRFQCTYNDALFTNPTMNAYRVMDPSFRNPLVDSYGQTMKFTWWMMGGNIFRYATNKNFPLPNTMTLYLMRKYHGPAIAQFGDELTMHYHTFVWTDYNKDGLFFWNQAKNFLESRDDFDVALSQYLLEEETFPVSFRSGWHAMDNDWQQYLDGLLPYSMHDAWPSIRNDTTEPIDNVYDWSKSSKEWVPFHPSATNYQLPGNLKGWNLRSTHIGGVDSAAMVAIFAKANSGTDQVACLWGHLPETDFLDNMKNIDRVAHIAAAKYPNVKFRYCSAVEAMQRWLGTNDLTPPVLTLAEKLNGDQVSFIITTNEPLFQAVPFVAVKDLYERYARLSGRQTGTNQWTTDAVSRSTLVKVGVAATDTVGNLRTAFIRYVPDDIYIDNRESGYNEVRGSWGTTTNRAWGVDARTATLAQGDSAKVQWKPPVTQSGRYNISFQVPGVSNAAGNILFRVINNGQVIQTMQFEKPLTSGDWIYVATAQLDAGATPTIEMVVRADGQVGKVAAADVLKLSALVRDRQIVLNNASIDFGEVSETDTARFALQVQNRGISSLTVSGVESKAHLAFPLTQLPIIVPPMQSRSLQLGFSSSTRGNISDSLFVTSDDPLQSCLGVPLTAKVLAYFTTIDNEDSLRYREFGTWYFSNAQAFGASSRYSQPTDAVRSYVRYSTTLKRSGLYSIQMIVPSTSNASTMAKYVLSVGGARVDSVVINQNVGSGGWVSVLSRSLLKNVPVDVTISDVTVAPVSGVVLRADALKFVLLQEATSVQKDRNEVLPVTFELAQNYPNPFNPVTRIRFAVADRGRVTLRVFDLLGREVAVLFDGVADVGWYVADFPAQNLASGMYLCRMEAGEKILTIKMMLVR